MESRENFTLIEGSFTTEDARDVLLSIFNAKINYYKLKNIISQERYGQIDEYAETKIQTLQSNIQKIRAMILEAKNHKGSLSINSEVNISFKVEESTADVLQGAQSHVLK